MESRAPRDPAAAPPSILTTAQRPQRTRRPPRGSPHCVPGPPLPRMRMPTTGRVTDCSSPHRKWAAGYQEEQTLAWLLALPSARHGAGRSREGTAAAPTFRRAVARPARRQHGDCVQGGDRTLGCEVARDPAAAGGQVGAQAGRAPPPRSGGGRRRRAEGPGIPETSPSGKMLLRPRVPSDQGPFRSDVHPVWTPPLRGGLPPNPSIPLHLRSSGASPRPLSIRRFTLHPFKPSGSLIRCFLVPPRARAP